MLERRQCAEGVWLVNRRNCALSPRRLCVAYLGLVALSLSIAALCAWIGAWVVLPWSVLELSLVGLAFLFWARHANDCERILAGPAVLRVEIHSAQWVRQYEFNPHWVQLGVDKKGMRRRVLLRSQGRQLTIGRYLDDAGRQQLVLELRAAIAAPAG